jgi:hypothetical protein
VILSEAGGIILALGFILPGTVGMLVLAGVEVTDLSVVTDEG